jgi:hypothetical protein
MSFSPNRRKLLMVVFTMLVLWFSSGWLYGQSRTDTLHVSSNITPEELVQQVLIGGGVFTSNITYTGADVSRGEFWGGPGNLGISDGVLLTSGDVTVAPGPNNSTGAGANVNTYGDPDLIKIAGTHIYDACVLEFDFVPQSSLVSFRYVFASEEYHEYVNQFNDAFGFFISGPGLSGPYSNNSMNIALIPLSFTPVSINTVNNGPSNTGPCTNCQYFVNNNQNFTQYDAFTTVLTAWANVIPCETYHIKLAIGDGSDHAYDSGVFLEAGSFTSMGISSEIGYTQEEYVDFAIEGCSDAEILFSLTDMPDEDFWLPVIIEGTATNGVDYQEINDSVFFPIGYTQATVDIITMPDDDPEWMESVQIIYNSSICAIDYDTALVEIWDYNDLYINTTPDTTINCSTQATIGVTGLGGFEPYNIIWSTGDTTDYITVSPLITTIYYVDVSALCDSIATDSIIVYVNGPDANAGSDQSIPYGTTTTLEGSAGAGSGDYTYSWEPAELLDDPASPNPTTINMELTTLFTLTVTDLAGGCQDLDQVLVQITGGPLGVSLIAQPDIICFGDQTEINSFAQGGTEDYTFFWTSDPPGFSSDLPTIVVQPEVTTTYYVVVDDGYNIAEGSVTVEIIPLPVAEAGDNDTINYGLYTVLNGSGSGGSGDYSYFWEPIDKLVNPYAQQPTTKNLTETTLFRLSIVDNTTTCTSAEEDLVTVVVLGGPLAVTAEAIDPMICDGGSTQLHALASGGNEYYEYTWYASTGPPPDPLNSPEPFVNPTTTTTYTVVVTDLFSVIEASVEVVVSPLPAVDLGADRYECPYDTITIEANIPGMTNYWSNGSTGDAIQVGTTGIGFDIKEIWLEMENEHGCKKTDTILVYFDFANCFGVGESPSGSKAVVYPNPTNDAFTLSLEGFKGGAEMCVSALDGRKVFSQNLEIEGDGTLQQHFSLAGQPRGIYLLKITGTREVLVSKIILE